MRCRSFHQMSYYWWLDRSAALEKTSLLLLTIFFVSNDASWKLRMYHIEQFSMFFFWVTFISSIFLRWLIISERQWFSRRCQFQDVVFAVVFLCDCTALTNFSTERYFKRDNSWRFFISHITASNVLFISAFLYIFHTYLCFLRRVTNMRITSVDET